MKEKTLLIIKAVPNLELGKPEYIFEYPDTCHTTRLLGILELVKYELLINMEIQNEEMEE